jgi:hypothetical protein
MPTATAKKAKPTKTKPEHVDVPTICAKLQDLQKQRAWFIKTRNKINNRLVATVAGYLGYSNKMEEKERAALFDKAADAIKAVVKGDVPKALEGIHKLITTTKGAMAGFDHDEAIMEKSMKELAQQLPVAKWVEHQDQAGLSILGLAVLIGETGDLNSYSNPGKVWRRMGCAPFESEGKVAMGRTWAMGKEGKLSADQWTEFGYSRRRRAIAYMIGTNLIRQNYARGGGEVNSETDTPDGPYRAHYLTAKTRFKALHPDYSDGRCHLHGMLLATKLLLKRLWVVWTEAKPDKWSTGKDT